MLIFNWSILLKLEVESKGSIGNWLSQSCCAFISVSDQWDPPPPHSNPVSSEPVSMGPSSELIRNPAPHHIHPHHCSSLLYYNHLHLGLNTKDSSHISSNFPVMLLMLKMTARNGGTAILDNSRMRTCFPYMISVLVLPAGICNSTGIRYYPDHSSRTLTRKKQEWMNVNTDIECEWMYSMLLCNSSSLNVRSNTTTTRRGNKGGKTPLYSHVLTSCGKHVGMATLPARLSLWSPPDTRRTSAV